MSTSHFRPNRAWAQQILTLLVATCLTLLWVSAGAAARTQPTATISSATLRSAIAARTADKRAHTHDTSRLTSCLRTDYGHCGDLRISVAHSRAKLTAAERYVLSLSARIARVRHAHTHSGSGTSGSSSTSGSDSTSGSGTRGSSTTGTGTTGSGSPGGDSSTNGSSSSGSDSTVGSGTSGSSTTGINEVTIGGKSGSSTNPFGEPFVKGVVTNIQGWGVSAMPKIASEMTTLGVNWAREDLSWA